jgi:hypothetical protein
VNGPSVHRKIGVCLSSLFVSQESSQISENKEFTTESFLKSINEKDNGQSTDNIYILAKRQLESNEPVNLEVINKYLAHFSLFITQEEFDILLSIRKVEFELPYSCQPTLLL